MCWHAVAQICADHAQPRYDSTVYTPLLRLLNLTIATTIAEPCCLTSARRTDFTWAVIAGGLGSVAEASIRVLPASKASVGKVAATPMCFARIVSEVWAGAGPMACRYELWSDNSGQRLRCPSTCNEQSPGCDVPKDNVSASCCRTCETCRDSWSGVTMTVDARRRLR